MATEITETEVVAGQLRRVSLGSQSFRVPLTPTISYMFWMRGFLKRFGDDAITDDDIVDCYDQTVRFLRRYNDKVDEEKLQDTCELSDLITFYSRCFSGAGDEDAGDARPPRRRGTSGPKRPAARSRS